MTREDWLLIVDDNAATRYAMRRVLERHGYRVLEAGTGGEGLAHIAQSPVGVVILDVNLPQIQAGRRVADEPVDQIEEWCPYLG